jgi:hypothetical protein
MRTLVFITLFVSLLDEEKNIVKERKESSYTFETA